MYQLCEKTADVSIDEWSSKRRVMQATTKGSVSTETELTTEQLLIAVGNKSDRKAFSQLFKIMSPKVFAQGMKILRNEQLARDLVQEAMLAVWQKALLYDVDKGSAQGWIFTLARNRCFDMLRQQQRQPNCISADDLWPTGDVPVPDDGAQDQLEHIEREEMKKLYEQLPAAQRDVVVQVFVQGMTHQETALKLNIPLGTVKSRLRVALCKLKTYLGSDL
jgi:RNA polymerase sigma-70 factor (ECF subfamily)